MNRIAIIIFLFHANMANGYCQQYELDPGFGNNGIVKTMVGNTTSSGKAGILQNDGKIVVVGSTTEDFAVLRYNSTGKLDSTFSDDGIVVTNFFGNVDNANDVDLQPDGKIIVVGTTTNNTGHTDVALARYNTNGTLDQTFSSDGKVNTNIAGNDNDFGITLKVLSSGKIIVFGHYSNIFNPFILRYNENGSLDSTFGTNGKIIFFNKYVIVNSLAMQQDGKILLLGSSYLNNVLGNNFYISRISQNGEFDNTFGLNGSAIFDVCPDVFVDYTSAHSAICLADNSILLGGNCSNKFALLKLLPNGQIDSTFGTNGLSITSLFSFSNHHNVMSIQNDGKILVGGKYGHFSLLRMYGNGVVDSTLSQDGIFSSSLLGDPVHLTMQPDQKLIQVGTSENRIAMVRYQPVAQVNTAHPELYSNIEIFPNPASDVLFLKYHLNSTEQISIHIQNMDGKTIKHSAFEEWVPYGENQMQIPLTELTNGVYNIQIRINGYSSNKRFVVLHK